MDDLNGLFILTSDQLKKIIREELKNALQIKNDTMSIVQRFNIEDAASYVGLPVPSFRIHQHKIGGIKIGKRWMFTKAELDRFLEANRRKTQQEIREAI